MTNLEHNSPKPPAAPLAVEHSKVILPQQYPAWIDGHGWNQPQQYKTIQLGDLDGDGKAEIVISDTHKIRAFRWVRDGTVHLGLQEIGTPQSAGSGGWAVQLADIDGDGKAEVIGRSLGRMYYDLPYVKKLIRGPHGEEWQERHKKPIEGLHNLQYFSTVQFADIDGDGKAELIARSPEGLIAFRYKADEPLEQIASNTGIMADADGWSAPQSYLTIQTAHIGGEDKGFAKFAVIGRGPDGIQTWVWSADTGPAAPRPGGAVAKLGFRTTAVNGFYQPTEPGFPDYSKSPGQLRAYQLLSQYLLDVVAAVWPPAEAKPTLQDIRGAYMNALLKSHWVNMADQLTKLAGKQVEGISPGDFETVRKQLHTELIFVDCAYIWFGNTKEVINSLFPADEATVKMVQGNISVPPDYAVKVLLDIASVVAAIVGAMAAVVMGFVIVATGGAAAPIAIPAIAAVTALIAMSLRVGSSYAGNGGNALELEVRHVQETLLNNWMRAPEANDHLLEVFLQHWGFLRQLGERITALQLVWPPSLTDKMVVQGRRAYELSVWQTLSQSTWVVVGYNWAKDRTASTPKYGLWYDDKVHPGKWLFIETWKMARQYNDVPEATLERVFGKPDENNPTSPLGVPVEDVMLARNGWKLFYDTGYDLPLPPPQEPPTLLRRERTNPGPRRVT